MKIAIIAPPFERTPPKKYGGTERIVSLLAEGLVSRGHDVTLFATGDSITNGKLKSYFDSPVRPYDENVGILHHVLAIADIDNSFDIIHNHNWNYACFSLLTQVPMITTLHNDHSDLFKLPVFQEMNLNLIAISDKQKQSISESGTKVQYMVHNAIDFSNIAMCENKENYTVFLGDVAAYKGAHTAINVSLEAKIPIKIAGKIKGNEAFFDEKISPYLDGENVVYVGELNDTEKYELLKKARVLLFPIEWEEPFGLVMIEAMACGTPVVAFDRGAVSEIVANNKTGFIVNTAEEMVNAIKNIDSISYKQCRAHAELFSLDKMIQKHIDIYQEVLTESKEDSV